MPVRGARRTHKGKWEEAHRPLESPELVRLGNRGPDEQEQLQFPKAGHTEQSACWAWKPRSLGTSPPGKGPVFVYSGKPWLAKVTSAAGQELGRAKFTSSAEWIRLTAPTLPRLCLPVAICIGQINYQLSNLPSCCIDTTPVSVYK